VEREALAERQVWGGGAVTSSTWRSSLFCRSASHPVQHQAEGNKETGNDDREDREEHDRLRHRRSDAGVRGRAGEIDDRPEHVSNEPSVGGDQPCRIRQRALAVRESQFAQCQRYHDENEPGEKRRQVRRQPPRRMRQRDDGQTEDEREEQKQEPWRMRARRRGSSVIAVISS